MTIRTDLTDGSGLFGERKSQHCGRGGISVPHRGRSHAQKLLVAWCQRFSLHTRHLLLVLPVSYRKEKTAEGLVPLGFVFYMFNTPGVNCWCCWQSCKTVLGLVHSSWLQLAWPFVKDFQVCSTLLVLNRRRWFWFDTRLWVGSRKDNTDFLDGRLVSLHRLPGRAVLINFGWFA